MCPPLEGVVDGIDLSLLDPADEDERRLLIEAEHPDLRRALKEQRREIRQGQEIINPTLHITMHEIAAKQIWDREPSEVWETAQRLVAAGYDRHEVLHMLASVVSSEVFQVMTNQEPPTPAEVSAALAALPDSWERRRTEAPAVHHQNRADRRAAARKHRR